MRRAGLDVTTQPGQTLSLYLGWSGLALMIIMHVYTARKKFAFLDGVGHIKYWLNFHIFCGTLGPTLILFHCDFKVRGLVAISFWSMLIAATSGILGRYFYESVAGLKGQMEDEVEKWSNVLDSMVKKMKTPLTPEEVERLKTAALAHVGVHKYQIGLDGAIRANPIQILYASLAGDLRLMFGSPLTVKGLPAGSRQVLQYFALAQRKVLFLQPYRDLLSYWHTFHIPFSVFMYVAAVIHVASSLLFGV